MNTRENTYLNRFKILAIIGVYVATDHEVPSLNDFCSSYASSFVELTINLTFCNSGLNSIYFQLYPVLVLQVGDLQYASPATVSRAGMVYVDPKNLGYEPYWQRWLSQLNRSEEDKETLARYKPHSVQDFIFEKLGGARKYTICLYINF